MDAEGGGRGRRRQRALCAEVGSSLSARGRVRSLRSLLGTTLCRQPHRQRAGGGDHGATTACASPRPRSPRCSAWRSRPSPAILTRSGMGRLGRLGLEQPLRYERSRPGELVHIDVKKLGRIDGGAGWRVRGGAQHYNRTFTDAHGHSAGRSASSTCTSPSTTSAGSPTPRCSRTRRRLTAVGFLRRAVAFYRRHGIASSASSPTTAPATARPIHALACRRLGIRHLRTRPYRPQTNGKAERFIRTLLARLGVRRDLSPRAANAAPHLTAGSGTTTIAGDTQRSATNPRSPEPTCSGPTPRGARAGSLRRRGRGPRRRARSTAPSTARRTHPRRAHAGRFSPVRTRRR